MARPKTAHAISLTFVEDLIRRHLDLAGQIARLQNEQAKVDDQLRVALEASDEKRFDTDAGRAQLVAQDIVTFDLDVLRDAISPEMLERVTTRHVDAQLVEAAAVMRTIDPKVVARARRTHHRKWRLRVRPR